MGARLTTVKAQEIYDRLADLGRLVIDLMVSVDPKGRTKETRTAVAALDLARPSAPPPPRPRGTLRVIKGTSSEKGGT